ncbi:MAG: hypothetical protein AVDCRST_MAG90-2314 [uncultured Microvirga sp.]|uniref:Uncharacterized protein n=1 Tax=uncultured Microvirga sp. TaxID=412392 RepID=A0A6J4M4N2_9HYPH|nr:MAG: hypothetical protein AVDCRST_MAG90-2314 [uncultured Microvirga sp.]
MASPGLGARDLIHPRPTRTSQNRSSHGHAVGGSSPHRPELLKMSSPSRSQCRLTDVGPLAKPLTRTALSRCPFRSRRRGGGLEGACFGRFEVGGDCGIIIVRIWRLVFDRLVPKNLQSVAARL